MRVSTTVACLAIAAGVSVSAVPAALVWQHSTEQTQLYRYDHSGRVADLVNGQTADVLVPECTAEDGGTVVPCRWDATTHGNGRGPSYAVVEGPNGWEYVDDTGAVSFEPRP